MVYHYSMVRVAHSGMTADEMLENVMTALSTISAKLATVSKSFVFVTSPLSFVHYYLLFIIFLAYSCVLNRMMFFFFCSSSFDLQPLNYDSLSDRKKHKNYPFEESDFSCAAHLHLRPESSRIGGGGTQESSFNKGEVALKNAKQICGQK